MEICNLKHINVFVFFYFALFVWQYLIHHIRFTMLKHYIREGYRFIETDWNGGFVSLERRKSLGISQMGISRHRKYKRSYSWIADIIYYLSVLLVPCYFLYSCQNYLDCKPSSEMVMVWIILYFALLIYFNAKRYRYYIKHRESHTKWGEALK